mmetsp:Transcript_140993/g.256281  ORF Transcript_140993/g.256281 Transcript_140993/m.256281 type:complete len:433 (-) Transcript_140993:242-1540(-)
MKSSPRVLERACSVMRNSRPWRPSFVDHSTPMMCSFSRGASHSSTSRGMQWPTATRLQDLHDLGLHPGERRKHAQFLHGELQTRFTHSLQELESLPHGLSQRRHVQKVIRCYEDILRTLEELPTPSSDLQDREFVDALRNALCEDGDTVGNLVASLRELGDDMGLTYRRAQPEVDAAVERFLRLHISQRFLANHYIEPTFSRSGRLGAFQLQCHLGEVARGAADQCISLCKSQLGAAPRIIIDDESSQRAMASKAHVHYILTEIFKNALRAVVENWGEECRQSGKPLPAIKCEITQDDAEATLKISDMGGGIAQTRMDDIWKYSFSTSRRCDDDRKPASAMSGYGVGLPMSRLYARYFGGDLAICSVSGVGTDVYYRLSFRGTELENLPQQEPQAARSPIVFTLPPWLLSKSSWPLSTLRQVRAVTGFATRR